MEHYRLHLLAEDVLSPSLQVPAKLRHGQKCEFCGP